MRDLTVAIDVFGGMVNVVAVVDVRLCLDGSRHQGDNSGNGAKRGGRDPEGCISPSLLIRVGQGRTLT